MKEFAIRAQEIPGPQRHSFILQSFENLEPGEALVIINTHDPIPLIRQMQDIHGPQLGIEYLAKGPTEWQVRFIKNKVEGCCGCCD
ncbi:MAG TPA: DUF2249 domain-containing protein [Bdellovibrio sp.]|uniref:DUF2249 domain-containing protein n=1 Tax=Bdellovibrio sp. TaxID=28201 RepID=UPI002F13FEB6